VKLACHILTGSQVAVEVLEKGERMPILHIMKTLDHPNMIKLFWVMDRVDHIYLVMEHASEGSYCMVAYRLVGCQKRRPRRIRQITCTIHYCHQRVLCTEI
jgi:serine/threonine protein kinase